MSEIQRFYPIVYNYRNERLADLNEAIDIVEELNFSKLNRLTFEYPYWLVDTFGVLQLDENGERIKNPKVNFIQNESIIVFKGRYYVIKKDFDARTNSRDAYVRVECEDFGYELTENILDFINLTPPNADPQPIDVALYEILASAQTVRTSTIQSVGSGTVTLDSNASNVNDAYNGYVIETLSAGGLGASSSTITDYNGSTKVATVSTTSGFSSGASYRIWNPSWTLGTIDSSFDIGNRTHRIEFQTLYASLNTVLAKYPNSDTRLGQLQFDISYNPSTSRWEKVINIVDANTYKGFDIRYRQNIKSISREQDTSQIYTRILPEGKDGLTIGPIGNVNRADNGVTYPAHQSGYGYIDNFQYYLGIGYTYKECLDNFVKEYRYFDDVYVDSQDLFDNSFNLLEKLSKPKIVYTTSIVDLSKLVEGKYQDFEIGDIVQVFDEDFGLNITATVEKITARENEPWNSQIELTNFNDRLSDIIASIIVDTETRTRTITGKLAFSDDVGEGDLNTTIVSGGKIVTGLLTASNIQTGTLDADKVNVTNLNADNITTGTIGANRISVTNLSSINADLGTVTAGTLDVGNAGITSDGALSSSIRFWAGGTYANRSSSPFRVEQSGSLFASGAEIDGRFTVSNGGTLLTEVDSDANGGRYNVFNSSGDLDVTIGVQEVGGAGTGGHISLRDEGFELVRIGFKDFFTTLKFPRIALGYDLENQEPDITLSSYGYLNAQGASVDGGIIIIKNSFNSVTLSSISGIRVEDSNNNLAYCKMDKDAFYRNGEQGVTQNVTISGTTLIFSGGILVGVS